MSASIACFCASTMPASKSSSSLTCDQVWELLKEGCNAAEIGAAAGVDALVAQSMVDEALGRPRGATLRAQARAPLTMRGA